MGVTSAAWIMSGLSITVWTQIRSLTHVESIIYPPCLCFVFFLLSSACKAANRWREDGMWGRCCDWPGKGHAHHVSPCGKSGYILTPWSPGAQSTRWGKLVLWSWFSITWMGENFSEWRSYVMQPTSVLMQSDPNLCTLKLWKLWRVEDYLQKEPDLMNVSFSRLGSSHHRFLDSEGAN